MAIDAKYSFMKQVERRCADRLTVTNMNELMDAQNDVLQGFRMEELVRDRFDMTQDDMIMAYFDSLRVQGRSEKTLRRYEYILKIFFEHAKAQIRDINVYHIRNWLMAEKKRGMKDSTLEGDRSVLSSFFGWLHREGMIEKNPMSNVGVIKVAKRQKKTFSDIDMEKLKANCKTIRDKAIVMFLRATGCRISEMTGLNRDDVDMQRLQCVVRGKGNKERTVYLTPVAGMVLMEYLESRTDDCEALFAGQRERLLPNGVRCMLKQLGRAAGVENVHPHKFRRTMATEMARNGAQVQVIASLLGHENLDTTMEYVMMNDDDRRDGYRRFA